MKSLSLKDLGRLVAARLIRLQSQDTTMSTGNSPHPPCQRKPTRSFHEICLGATARIVQPNMGKAQAPSEHKACAVCEERRVT